jgi:hypothetical protein
MGRGRVMADPVTWAMIAAGTALAGTGMSAFGKIQEGAQTEAISEAESKLATEKAAVDEEAIRLENRRIIGKQAAIFGSSGVTLEGSPMSLMLESTRLAELDALRARWGGKAESTLKRMYGENARTASYWGAGSTILTGLSQAFSSMSAFGAAKGGASWSGYGGRPSNPNF